jgi:hypothetical protein
MSVTLISQNPLYAFSGDQLKLQFQCENRMEVMGAKSVNGLTISSALVGGATISLKYGQTEVLMRAEGVPDDSGYQIPSGTASEIDLLPYFQSNYILSRDFHITVVGTEMIFTAKQEYLGFDFVASPGGSWQTVNKTPGVVSKEKANYGIYFRLYCQNPSQDKFEMIYDRRLPVVYGSNGIAELSIGERLHEYISEEIRNSMPDIPESDPLLCKKSCRKYYYEFAESYGDPITIMKLHKSPTYSILHGGLSTIGEATSSLSDLISTSSGFTRFLKQGDQVNLTRSNQRQYLYYYNPAAQFHVTMNCRLRFTDGSKVVIRLHDLDLPQFSKYAFNVGYEKVFNAATYPGRILLAYDIWLSGSNGVRVSDSQTYIMDYRPLQFIRYFVNWSSWGTMDSRMFYGRGSIEFDLVQSEAEKSNRNPSRITQGNSLVYDIRLTSKLSITTGFISTRRMLVLNRDFFLSPMKYRVLGDLLLPIKVTSKTIPELEDGNNLYAQKFEYEYLFDDHAYTEGDVQEPGISYGQTNIGSSEIFLTDKERVFLITPQNEFITI